MHSEYPARYDMLAIEEEARRLRAEAMRHAFSSFRTWVSNLRASIFHTAGQKA